MKAIVVRQPFATLIALGVKTIETRPSPPNGPMRPDGVRGLPGCSLERGERIAIVAGAQPGAEVGEDLGDSGWYYESTAGDPSCVVNWRHFVSHEAPLGAVVCTVTVDDALRVIDPEDYDAAEWGGDGLILVDPANALLPVSIVDDNACRFMQPSEAALGDFTPGRWGWMLSDPQPITKPCGRCGGRGSIQGSILTCLAGCTVGRVPADPIPCKGRQGVFELPAEITEQLS